MTGNNQVSPTKWPTSIEWEPGDGTSSKPFALFIRSVPCPPMRPSCDQCGACCKGHLIVEAYELDVLREQHLATADIGEWTRDMTYETLIAALEQEGRCLVIVGGDECKFLRGDNTCAIYPTRPNVCVGLQAGDEQCQEARIAEGLPPLTCSDLS